MLREFAELDKMTDDTSARGSGGSTISVMRKEEMEEVKKAFLKQGVFKEGDTPDQKKQQDVSIGAVVITEEILQYDNMPPPTPTPP